MHRRLFLCVATVGDCENNIKIAGEISQTYSSIALEIDMARVARWGICAAAVMLFGHDTLARATEGQVFIIGGGLRPDNAELYHRLIAAGDGPKNCRVAIFRTASISSASAELFRG